MLEPRELGPAKDGLLIYGLSAAGCLAFGVEEFRHADSRLAGVIFVLLGLILGASQIRTFAPGAVVLRLDARGFTFRKHARRGGHAWGEVERFGLVEGGSASVVGVRLRACTPEPSQPAASTEYHEFLEGYEMEGPQLVALLESYRTPATAAAVEVATAQAAGRAPDGDTLRPPLVLGPSRPLVILNTGFYAAMVAVGIIICFSPRSPDWSATALMTGLLMAALSAKALVGQLKALRPGQVELRLDASGFTYRFDSVVGHYQWHDVEQFGQTVYRRHYRVGIRLRRHHHRSLTPSGIHGFHDHIPGFSMGTKRLAVLLEAYRQAPGAQALVQATGRSED